MLSRVAETIYWMARHLERAENTARLVAVQSETRLDRPGRAGFFWEPALRVTGTLADFEARGLSRTERDATNFLVSDPSNPSSVLGIVSRARENIRTLREVLPRESWEAVNALHQVASRPGAAAPQRRDAHLREVVGCLQGMAGLFLGAMNDDAGYAFLRLGRAVERGDFAIRVLLDAMAAIPDGASEGQAFDATEWIAVLKSLTAYQMYRRSLGGPVTRLEVIRFLACSTTFPRALAACAAEAERALARMSEGVPTAAPAARLFAVLAANSAASDEERLAGVLALGQADLLALHDAVTAAYFAPPLPEAAPLAQSQTQRSA